MFFFISREETMEVISIEELTARNAAIDRRRLRRITQINYMIAGVLLVMVGVMLWQMNVLKQMPVVETSTPILLSLEGDGVVPQKHDLSLRKEDAQQTVVFTELETINGAPIVVSVSTDTSDKGDKNVVIDNQ